MDVLSIILISIGLAMDCFAVSTAKGLQHARWSMWAVLMAVLFGLFQGGMPLIGYFAGTLFADFFSRFSPWIALALLAFIGGKMIWESVKGVDEAPGALVEAAKPLDVATLDEAATQLDGKTGWSVWNLIVLAIATSIDALATGVIFIPVPEVLWLAIGVIAFTSFAFSITGYLIGVFVGNRFKLNVELIGGLILIAIGLKIWIEGVIL